NENVSISAPVDGLTVAKPEVLMMAPCRPARCAVRCPGRRSKSHHDPADNVARSQPLEIFVDLVEPDDIDGVSNLVLPRARHDLDQVEIVAAGGAMKGLFARNAREQRDVDPVADQSRISIVAAD